MFNRAVSQITPLSSLSKLPNYGFQFFFSNMGAFRLPFWILTICSVASTLVNFLFVYLLGDLISNATSLTLDRVLYYYLPLSVGAKVVEETLDFFMRRYAEGFPHFYIENFSLRINRTMLDRRFHRLFNFSKERLTALTGKYSGNIASFLNDWFWGTSRRITQLVIVLVILGFQSPLVLAANLVFVALFLTLSLSISKRFSPVAQAFTEQAVRKGSVIGNFLMQLNTVKRLGISEFFEARQKQLVLESCERITDVRKFHSRRWLLQLNLFNFLYLGTLFYGAYQVTQGSLTLGYLVLIKYAFDQLWGILVYIIEYYVSLVQQKADAEIVRREFEGLFPEPEIAVSRVALNDWKELALQRVKTSFALQGEESKTVTISVPDFRLKAGERVAILGPSGSGKSTILNLILGLLPFTGEVRVDGTSFSGKELAAEGLGMVSSSDPLFNLSRRDNILLGREVDAQRFSEVLRGVEAESFLPTLDAKIGDPKVNLSTGQAQRIKLARGLIVPASLYLFDEPFTGLDSGTKKQVMEFVEQETRGRAVILVTHDPQELTFVDRVYELANHTLILRS